MEGTFPKGRLEFEDLAPQKVEGPNQNYVIVRQQWGDDCGDARVLRLAEAVVPFVKAKPSTSDRTCHASWKLIAVGPVCSRHATPATPGGGTLGRGEQLTAPRHTGAPHASGAVGSSHFATDGSPWCRSVVAECS